MCSALLFSYSYAEVEKLYYLALNGSEEEKSAAAKILCSASLSRGWNLQVGYPSTEFIYLGVVDCSGNPMSHAERMCIMTSLCM